jgi:oligopeptide transport system ATP-binding protein
MAPLLEVKDLRVEFNTADGVVKAVNGISYTIEEGEIVGIVGESGSGKSVGVLSLMRLIPEQVGRIVSGEVWFQGQDLLKLAPEKLRQVRGNEIAMIFQDPMTSLNPVLTIGKQIGESLKLHQGLDDNQAQKRAIELMDMVGLPMAAQRIHQYPHQLSGGLRQRVMIAMGLSCDPRLLIADEPTTALDVTIQAQILREIKRLQKELGMAVIWITHDLGVVAGLVEKVLVMYGGHIVERAQVDDLYDRPRHPYTLGLLQSIPHMATSAQDLTPIEGLPPDLTNLPAGCPFAARCSFVVEMCRQENPALEAVGEEHTAACWVDVRKKEIR